MTRSSHRRFVVHCILSAAAMGCAEKGRIIDSGLVGAPHPPSHSLIDGDYLALKRARLNGFLEEHLPLELEFQDSHQELTITAAE